MSIRMTAALCQSSVRELARTTGISAACILLLSGCINPLGTSIQNPTFHPGYTSADAPPQITSVSPSSGALQGGTLLTVEGTGFQADSVIRVDGLTCLNMTWVSSTRMTCTTPGHPAGSVSISVTNPNSQSSTLASAFQYIGSSNSPAKFAGVSGGGTVSGPGVRLKFSAGAVGNPPIQSGTGVSVKTGPQGALSQP